MDTKSQFDLRLSLVPGEWKQPLANVIDTADSVRLALKEWGLENDGHLLLELTKMVFSERERIKAEAITEASQYSFKPVPVPVSERMPGPLDVDDEYEVMAWFDIEAVWRRVPVPHNYDESYGWGDYKVPPTHWLRCSDWPTSLNLQKV